MRLAGICNLPAQGKIVPNVPIERTSKRICAIHDQDVAAVIVVIAPDAPIAVPATPPM